MSEDKLTLEILQKAKESMDETHINFDTIHVRPCNRYECKHGCSGECLEIDDE